MRNFKIWMYVGLWIGLSWFASCAKIDDYKKPHMLEGYTGIIKVTPGIKGITAKTYAPGLVFFNSNADGTEVIMYGPTTENFSLYSMLPDDPEKKTLFREEMEKKGISLLDKLDFSGFRAKVDPKDGKKIKFFDFASQSDGMKKFEWKVEGTGLIAGPDTHINITISTTLGKLQELMPVELLEELGDPNSELSLAEIDDKKMIVYLARIQVLGQSLTFGY